VKHIGHAFALGQAGNEAGEDISADRAGEELELRREGSAAGQRHRA
jgi:hypothetical protein